MTIEFQTPYGKVSEKLVGMIRNALLELSHRNKKITRAEVSLMESNLGLEENQVCEIKLNVLGKGLLAHCRTNNFATSAEQAVRDLKKQLNLRRNK